MGWNSFPHVQGYLQHHARLKKFADLKNTRQEQLLHGQNKMIDHLRDSTINLSKGINRPGHEEAWVGVSVARIEDSGAIMTLTSKRHLIIYIRTSLPHTAAGDGEERGRRGEDRAEIRSQGASRHGGTPGKGKG